MGKVHGYVFFFPLFDQISDTPLSSFSLFEAGHDIQNAMDTVQRFFFSLSTYILHIPRT